MKLIEEWIADLPSRRPRGKDKLVKDGTQPGLYVRVTSAGGKSVSWRNTPSPARSAVSRWARTQGFPSSRRERRRPGSWVKSARSRSGRRP